MVIVTARAFGCREVAEQDKGERGRRGPSQQQWHRGDSPRRRESLAGRRR